MSLSKYAPRRPVLFAVAVGCLALGLLLICWRGLLLGQGFRAHVSLVFGCVVLVVGLACAFYFVLYLFQDFMEAGREPPLWPFIATVCISATAFFIGVAVLLQYRTTPANIALGWTLSLLGGFALLHCVLWRALLTSDEVRRQYWTGRPRSV